MDHKNNKQENNQTGSGVCQNDATVQSVCNTSHRIKNKVKGKGTHPFAPREDKPDTFS